MTEQQRRSSFLADGQSRLVSASREAEWLEVGKLREQLRAAESEEERTTIKAELKVVRSKYRRERRALGSRLFSGAGGA